jgi:hypothetical protein
MEKFVGAELSLKFQAWLCFIGSLSTTVCFDQKFKKFLLYPSCPQSCDQIYDINNTEYVGECSVMLHLHVIIIPPWLY